MARIFLELSRDEINAEIPYSLICMTRYGSAWDTMHRKRRWKVEFSESEKDLTRKLFSQAHNWTVGRGVPESVQMAVSTYDLWQKLGNFCASI